MNRLEQAFSKFKRPIRVIAVRDAPQCIRILVEPLARTLVSGRDGQMTQISHLTNLTNDVAAMLGTGPITVRADRYGIWLEIAKPRPDAVLARDLVPPPWQVLPIVLGKDVSGEVVSVDLVDPTTPHVLIAGTTGSGKSVLLQAITYSLAMQPHKAVVSIIDPHGGYDHWRNAKQVCYLVSDSNQALTILRGARSLADSRLNSPDLSARYVIIIDEFANLLDGENGKEIEELIIWLLANARKAGIHIIAATQYPGYEVCRGLMKANFPVRIAMRTASASDSRVTLGQGGAEKLAGNGDGYLSTVEGLVRFQGGWVDEVDARSVMQKSPPGKKALARRKKAKRGSLLRRIFKGGK